MCMFIKGVLQLVERVGLRGETLGDGSVEFRLECTFALNIKIYLKERVHREQSSIHIQLQQNSSVLSHGEVVLKHGWTFGMYATSNKGKKYTTPHKYRLTPQKIGIFVNATYI